MFSTHKNKCGTSLLFWSVQYKINKTINLQVVSRAVEEVVTLVTSSVSEEMLDDTPDIVRYLY